MQKVIVDFVQKNLDKVLHFIGGLLLAQLAYLNPWCLLLPLVVGTGKEICDIFIRKTGFNVKDILATSLGTIPVIFVLLLIHFLK